MTAYTFPVRITSIFERKLNKHVGGAGPDAIFTAHSAGWYIQLDDMISVYIGGDRPALEVGDEYELVLRKRSQK